MSNGVWVQVPSLAPPRNPVIAMVTGFFFARNRKKWTRKADFLKKQTECNEKALSFLLILCSFFLVNYRWEFVLVRTLNRKRAAQCRENQYFHNCRTYILCRQRRRCFHLLLPYMQAPPRDNLFDKGLA